MSGLVNKIKDAVHGDKKHEQPTGTSGPHDSRTANAADPRVDSDRDHRANPATGTTGTYGSSTTGGAGLGGDNFTQSGTGVTGAPGGHSNTLGSTGNTSSNRGPHDSNLANKADPRVDSDRDHRAAPGSTTGTSGLGSSNTAYGSTTGTTGTSGLGSSSTAYGSTTGTTGTSGLGSSNRGPHDSNLANKADPRVDSDRDHRAGGIGSTTGAGEYGSSHTTGAGEFGSAGRTTRSGAEYGSSSTAYGSTTGTTGTSGLGSSNRGPHDSNLANKADPRVDSDRDHRAAPGSTGVTGNNYGTTGSSGLTGNPGPAPNTAGPHKSDMLNKVDPRVDSDRDGSKTVGQDQTYARS